MQHLPITVTCHAGYKADEYPTAFTWLEKEYVIRDILDRWYQTDRDPELPAADYFKVRTGPDQVFILRHEREADLWFLVI